jgi:hypothetical protein
VYTNAYMCLLAISYLPSSPADASVSFNMLLLCLCRLIRRHQHLRKLLELRRPTNLLREQRQADDVEKVVVQFVRLVEVLELHLVADVTVLAVRRCIEYKILVFD